MIALALPQDSELIGKLELLNKPVWKLFNS